MGHLTHLSWNKIENGGGAGKEQKWNKTNNIWTIFDLIYSLTRKCKTIVANLRGMATKTLKAQMDEPRVERPPSNSLVQQ